MLAASSLPYLLLVSAYVAMLVGLATIVFIPFFPGLLVILAGLAAYVGYSSYQAHTLVGMAPVPLVACVLVSVLGLTSSWWSEKLGLHYVYLRQEAMWGAFLGMFVGLYFSLVGMIVGMIVGVVFVEIFTMKTAKGQALRQGVAAFLSMLGPRGFQLVMALLVVSLELRYLPDLRVLLP